jgi:uncharacterized protein YeaO (DUF488 family)
VATRSVERAGSSRSVVEDLAPIAELRKRFGHDPKKWRQFQSRYRKELRGKKAPLHLLKKESKERPITLLFGARDEEHNQAVVLKRVLDGR